MSQNDGPNKTITLGATVAVYELVKVVAGVGQLTTGVASEDGDFFGVCQEAGVSGDKVAVRSISAVASSDVKVAGAVSLGAKVYTGASGLGTATVTSLTLVGVALRAATAANDVIEVLRTAGGNDDIT